MAYNKADKRRVGNEWLLFYLFAELKRDLSLATKVMNTLTNGMVDSVTDIEFEWSPGKADPDLTGDRSAFDVYVTFSSPNGSKGFIGIEVKYHENLSGKSASHKERYEQIASQMNCFKETSLESLKRQPLQQIWRDHLLAGIHRIANGFEEGFFVFLHPEENTYCSEPITRYRECLTDADTFASWTLESVVSAIKRCTDDDWIDLFVDRYLRKNLYIRSVNSTGHRSVYFHSDGSPSSFLCLADICQTKRCRALLSILACGWY